MFDKCNNLETIVMKNVASYIHNGRYMFNACRKLTTIDSDIENWNTQYLVFGENMFANCELLKLNLSGWDIDELQVNTKMFYNAPGIKKPRRKKK